MQAESTGTNFATALALHLSLADAFLPAAFRRAASHLLGPASGKSLRTWAAQFSARHSQSIWLPLHEPAVAKANAVAYLPSTFWTHGPSSDGSPLPATLPWP